MAEPLILRFQDLTVDLDHYRVFLGDRRIVLSYREYALLVYLAGKAGQVVPKRRLLEEGLGRHDAGGLRLVDEHVRRLKSLLEREGRLFIHEVDASGYRFEPQTSGPTMNLG